MKVRSWSWCLSLLFSTLCLRQGVSLRLDFWHVGYTGWPVKSWAPLSLSACAELQVMDFHAWPLRGCQESFTWMSGILYVDVSFYTLSHLPSLPSYCFCKLAILHQGSTVRWSWFWVHSSCIHGSIVLQTWLVVRFVSIAPLLGSILLYHLFPPLCPPSCSQFSPILWPHFCSPALGRLFGLGSLVLEVCVNYASYRLEYMNTWPPVGGG